jgi:hypothetical protein
MLNRPQGHSAAGRILSMKNSNGTIGNRTSVMTYANVECLFLPQIVEAIGVQVLRVEKCYRSTAERDLTVFSTWLSFCTETLFYVTVRIICSVGQFCVMAANSTLTANPVCHESWSKCCGAVYWSFRFSVILFKLDSTTVCCGLPTRDSSDKHVPIVRLNSAGLMSSANGREVISDSCQDMSKVMSSHTVIPPWMYAQLGFLQMPPFPFAMVFVVQDYTDVI